MGSGGVVCVLRIRSVSRSKSCWCGCVYSKPTMLSGFVHGQGEEQHWVVVGFFLYVCVWVEERIEERR